MQKRQQKESRSRRALERELKSEGLFDESIFMKDNGNTESLIHTVEESQPDDTDNGEQSC